MDRFPLVIVGSGPGGLAAATQAATVGMDYVILERAQRFADTIQKFAKGKLVMNTPKRLPLQAGLGLSFAEGTVDRVLGQWRPQLEAKKVFKRMRFNSDVTRVARRDGVFRVQLAEGEAVEGENVVLALGTQGNISKLNVPGAERVRYQLDDPSEFRDKTIVIIGSGDTAIENALALADMNYVTLVVRGSGFKPDKVTVANLAAVEGAIRTGRIACRFNAQTLRLEPAKIVLSVGGLEEVLDCDEAIARIGSVKPRRFLEGMGVRFDNEDESADPAINERYCSDVPGLYVIGALAGFPLIKHCLNQGYEVVEHIRGADVTPADASVLAETFGCIAGGAGVEGALRRIAGTIPLFAGLTRLTLGDVLLDSRVVRKDPGDTVVRRAEYGDSIFAILEGAVKVEIRTEDRSKDRILKTGDFFGEMGLVSGRPRSATVRASEPALLIEVPRRAALKLLNAVPSAKLQMDKALVERQIRAYVSEELSASELEGLIAAARLVSFSFGETIIAPGGSNDVFLLQSGSAKVSVRSWERDVTLRHLPAGRMIGGYMHLEGEAPDVTVTAASVASKTAAIRIDGTAFAEVLARNAVVKRRLKERIEAELREDSHTAERSRNTGGAFDKFLSNGAGEATNILVIDEALCVRCDNCEKACAETHGGISRLDREAGPTFASLHMPTSCRHCQHPLCMSDCPADAIHRALNGEVYIDDSCIGCGACERNCPYGVISMASEPARPSSLLLRLLFGVGEKKTPCKSSNGHAHAVKCDMCQGLDAGPACVSACPTGAAIRVDPNQLLAMTMPRMRR